MQRLRQSALVFVLGVVAVSQVVRAEEAGPWLSRALERPGALKAWGRMLAGTNAPGWLSHYGMEHGAEGPSRTITIGGKPYEVYTACKPHDCFTSFAVVFAADDGAAWGALADYGKEPRFFGAPNPAVSAALR